MLQKYITYISPSRNRRRITVVDGQPYYESTGENSGVEKIWYPFIMIRGTQHINWENISYTISMHYNFDFFQLQHKIFDEYHITKFEKAILAPYFVELPHMQDGRIPTKKTLITSCRLSGGTHYYYNLRSKAGLTESEIDLANIPIELEKAPELELTDPDKINQWLIQQGATLLQVLLNRKLNEISKPKLNTFDNSLMSKKDNYHSGNSLAKRESSDDSLNIFCTENKTREIKRIDEQEIPVTITQFNTTSKINSSLSQIRLETYGILQTENLKEREELLTKIVDKILTSLSAIEIYQYCEMKHFDSSLCVKILTSPNLCQKLDRMQSILIENCKEEVSIALFEKGNDFLSQFNTNALFEICKITAKKYPEISICMLSTPKLLLDKLNDDFLSFLFSVNPNIKDDYERKKINRQVSFHNNSLVGINGKMIQSPTKNVTSQNIGTIDSAEQQVQGRCRIM